MDDLIDTLLDHFQILELLGRGGMGGVYRARDLRLERDVAVKVMHRHIAEQGDFKERFLQEARSAARLDHPGIVNVYHFGQARDLLYIVMQYIPGANLREMLESLKETSAWVPLDETVQLVRQISLALDYAHRRGVLHRDIKPKNIMIEPEPGDGLPYRPVITDLGLAKLADSDFVTRPGSSMGTPAYMSPEQALGRTADARSDVYSLGVLLYELAVGRVPFPAQTITEAIRYHTEAAPPDPHAVRPDLPQSLVTIILKALEKEPTERFADAAQLAHALEDVTDVVIEATHTSTVVGDAVSLLTQYQDRLVRPRGPSLLAEFDTPPDLSRDSIQLLVDGKTIATVPIEREVLVIGRREDNELVLDDPKASRRHVQVTSDGADYRVVDLGSSNGTFLADTKLLPGVAEVWTPDKALRIGDTVLRLVRVRKPTLETAGRPSVIADPPETQTSSGAGWVGILMQTQKLSVEPGATAAATLTVFNQGPLVDHFDVAIDGVPAEWVSTSPHSVQLLPGQQQPVSVTFRPPRAPQSRAGQHTVTIRVTSESDPSQRAQIETVLTVAAYHQADLGIRPRKQSGVAEGEYALQVRNQCNADLTVRFEAVDMEDACRYTFDPVPMVVTAGGEHEGTLRVQPTSQLRDEHARTYTFIVTAHFEEASALTQQVQGIWVQVPPIYDALLRPTSQRGEERVDFTVVVTNQGEADLALVFDALDVEGRCRFDFSPPEITIPVGQTRNVELTVSPQAPLSPGEDAARPFTVTVKPAALSGYAQQLQGEWVQAAPPPPTVTPSPASQPISPSSAASTAQPAEDTAGRRRWFWGCVVLLVGLVVTMGVFLFVGTVLDEGFRSSEGLAWAGAISAGGLVLVLTLRVAYQVWRSRVSADEPLTTPSAAVPPRRRLWGAAATLVGLVVTGGLGLVAGNLAFEVFRVGDTGAWFAAGIVWLIGLVLSVRIGRKVFNGE